MKNKKNSIIKINIPLKKTYKPKSFLYKINYYN